MAQTVGSTPRPSSPPPSVHRPVPTATVLVVLAVVVVAVVVLALVLGGFVPGVSSSSSSGSGSRNTYDVTFTETGLPSGTLWSVVLNGTSSSSSGSSITFSVPNGLYPYTIPAVSGYAPTSSNPGYVTVNGSAQTVSVHFRSSVPIGENFGWGAGTAQANATGASPSPCSVTNGITITATYCYTIQITGAGGGISTSNVLLALRGISGNTVAWPAAADVGISLLSPTVNGWVAIYVPSTSTWTANTGFSGAFTAGMTLVIGIIPVSGCGASGNCGLLNVAIEAVGQNGFTGVVVSNLFP